MSDTTDGLRKGDMNVWTCEAPDGTKIVTVSFEAEAVKAWARGMLAIEPDPNDSEDGPVYLRGFLLACVHADNEDVAMAIANGKIEMINAGELPMMAEVQPKNEDQKSRVKHRRFR